MPCLKTNQPTLDQQLTHFYKNSVLSQYNGTTICMKYMPKIKSTDWRSVWTWKH